MERRHLAGVTALYTETRRQAAGAPGKNFD